MGAGFPMWTLGGLHPGMITLGESLELGIPPKVGKGQGSTV